MWEFSRIRSSRNSSGLHGRKSSTSPCRTDLGDMTSLVSPCRTDWGDMTSLVSPCRTELEIVSFYLKKNPSERKLYLSGGFFVFRYKTSEYCIFFAWEGPKDTILCPGYRNRTQKRKFLRKWYRRTMDKMTRAKMTRAKVKSNGCQSYTTKPKSRTFYKIFT